MDRASDTTDAYVEIKLGSNTQKTEVKRKTLNPQFNSEWFRFEVSASEVLYELLWKLVKQNQKFLVNSPNFIFKPCFTSFAAASFMNSNRISNQNPQNFKIKIH